MGLRVRDSPEHAARLGRHTFGPATAAVHSVRGRPPQTAAEHAEFATGDRFETGGIPRLRSGADGGAPIREAQALDFLTRADALRLTLDSEIGRLELQSFAVGLAAQFTAAPAGNAHVLDQFLAQATDLRDMDLEILRRYLELLHRLLEEDASIGGFLQHATAAAAGSAADALGSANAFLQDLAAHVDVSFSAQVAQFYASLATVQDGRHVAVTVQATQVSISISQTTDTGDPLVLDLDGDGIELTTVGAGRRFDLDGDGRTDQTAFVAGGDGVLALDRNGNGTIDSGRELFGDQHGAAHGFAELARFDENADGTIDGRDRVFDELRVLGDFDGDGVVRDDETRSLAELGIAGIDLATRDVRESAAGGNTLAQRGSFTRTDGSRGLAADALLRYRRG